MIMIKRYMHLWHVCLIIKKNLVESLVKICNRTIEFYIQEQRVISHLMFRILSQAHYNKQINTLKLQMYIVSQLIKSTSTNKNVQQ